MSPVTPPTWVPGAAGSLWDVDNLPYAAVVPIGSEGSDHRVAVRIGDWALDLAAAAELSSFPEARLVTAPTLDRLIDSGPHAWTSVRAWLVDLLTDPAWAAALTPHLRPVHTLRPLLPFSVHDYVDFYASLDHATNAGRILRPGEEPLLPNWRHLPVGYHGRSGSVVVSGTPVRRPCGQLPPAAGAAGGPTYGPTARLDLEAELGFVVAPTLGLGERVRPREFGHCVFGVVGLNDWSARDIQAWEYRPLGPHLGKSFATSISAWVTPSAALEAARVTLPAQEPAVLPYLAEDPHWSYDIEVEVELDGEVVSRPSYAGMYWSPGQMLAHLTVNGAGLRPGDLFGSGTISGPGRDQVGSLLELSWGGAEPFVAAGRERTWLEDGDEVVLRYTAPGALGGRLALGEVRGRILPAAP